MKQIKLSGPEISPLSGKKPKQLIVFLHGVGADGNDLIGLAPEFSQDFPDAHFISPNGPFNYDMAPYGYQWFSLIDRAMGKMLEGARVAEPIVNAFLGEQLARFGLTENNLALIGFSQGTMMSIFSALRRKKPVAAIVGFSGAFIPDQKMAEGTIAKPPVCLIHGTGDQVLPLPSMFHAAKELENLGVKVEMHQRPGLGHGIDAEGIKIAIRFLKENLEHI